MELSDELRDSLKLDIKNLNELFYARSPDIKFWKDYRLGLEFIIKEDLTDSTTYKIFKITANRKD